MSSKYHTVERTIYRNHSLMIINHIEIHRTVFPSTVLIILIGVMRSFLQYSVNENVISVQFPRRFPHTVFKQKSKSKQNAKQQKYHKQITSKSNLPPIVCISCLSAT
eukprot:TCONS_00071904-protein